ncbi:hypothetical protein M885DRAFT_529699 [Pelagophyceae sp. CCMP2097]|nr:hypothetical protein M885DRAFT_529699 [Pelagophyceae sp. CCMP2097]
MVELRGRIWVRGELGQRTGLWQSPFGRALEKGAAAPFGNPVEKANRPAPRRAASKTRRGPPLSAPYEPQTRRSPICSRSTRPTQRDSSPRAGSQSYCGASWRRKM